MNRGGGWHRDPTGRADLRYHDGERWTHHVVRAGIQGVDPPDLPVPAPAQPGGGNGFAVTALVLGIIGAFLGLVPILALVAMPLGVLAVIFGLVGRAKRRPRRGMALAGTILGCVALGLGVIGVVIVGDALDELEDDIETAFNGEPAHPSEYLVDPGACAADGFTLRHEGTITNTAGRSYAFEIRVDFVDGDGVRLDQGTDYLDPLDPGQSASWTVTAFGDHDDPRCRVVEVRKRD